MPQECKFSSSSFTNSSRTYFTLFVTFSQILPAWALSLTVEDYESVFRLLCDHGYRVIASEHLLVRLEKHPGALAELSRRLADENVNVRGMHIVTKDEKAGIVALETADHEKARKILRDILVG